MYLRRYTFRILGALMLGVPFLLWGWLGYRLYVYDPPVTSISIQELAQVHQTYGALDGDKIVALTFDDGPRYPHTTSILDTLSARNAPATFFLVGESVVTYPEIAADIVARGFTVAAHSHTHGYDVHESRDTLERELRASRFAIETATGITPRVYRPPYQLDLTETVVNPQTAPTGPVSWMIEAGYIPVGADVDPYDWVVQSEEEMLTYVRLNLREGNILVFHDTEHTARALNQVLDLIESEGYSIVGLDRVLGLASLGTPTPVHALDRVALYSAASMERVLYALVSIAVLLVLVRLVLLTTLLGVSYVVERPQGRSSRALVSVVIPAWNEAENIEATMRSVLASRNVRAELIVVDDGSTDDTYAIATRIAASASTMRVTVVSKPNGGKASALNVGIAKAKGVVVVCLDADTIFDPDTISYLVGPLKDPAVGAVSGKVTIADATGLLQRMQALEYLIGQNVQKRALQMANAMSVIPGAVGAWRKRDIKLAGGVPTDTLVEDHDLTLAILKLGRTAVYESRAIAHTEAPKTVRAFLKQRIRWVQGAMQCAFKYRKLLFARKTPPGLRLVLMNAFAYDFFLPFFYPIVDIALIYTALTGTFHTMALPLLVFVLIDIAVVALATRGERIESPFILVFAMRLLYRHLLFAAFIVSFVRFVEGRTKGWQKLARTGDAQRMYFNALNGELPFSHPTRGESPL